MVDGPAPDAGPPDPFPRVPGLDYALDELAAHKDQLRQLGQQIQAVPGDLVDQLTALRDELAQYREAPPGRGYRPPPPPQLWKPDLPAKDRAAAVARLRRWVTVVYKPGYGHLAALLPACWDRHDFCLYALDCMSELWSVLYQPGIPGAKRTPVMVGEQSEFMTRHLPAFARLMEAEVKSCPHSNADSLNGTPR